MNQHITVLLTITDLASDGTQRQLLELVKGLDKRHFRPILLTLHSGGPMEEAFRAVPGLQLISIERRGRYDFLALVKISRVLRDAKVDVIQPFLTPATFFGLLPAIWCRTPVKIVTERASEGNKNAGFGYRIYLKLEDLLSHFSDWAVANSQAGREYLLQRGIEPSKTMVIYNGVNFNRLRPDREGAENVRRMLKLPPGGKVVGVMARLFPVKNHAMFLRAAALINAAMPETRFAIVGDGPLRSSLEVLNKNLGLGSKVVFFGEQSDVGTFLYAFDIAVLTSDAEGCSNSLLEAMALGKPVVATDVGGNREIIEHGQTGFLVLRGDAQAFAEAVLRLIKNPDMAQTMGQQARDMVVARFDPMTMVREYESLYEKTVKAKAGQRKGTA